MSLRAEVNGMFLSITPESGRAYLPARAWIAYALYVAFSLSFGIALLMLPWQSAWENNYFIYIYPKLHSIVSNYFFKGAVLGLGIVNLIMGVQEIIRLTKSEKYN
jgi:hypothetical protein